MSSVLAVSIPAAAKLAGISRALLFRLLADGNGPRTLAIGRRRLVMVADLEAWLLAKREAA